MTKNTSTSRATKLTPTFRALAVPSTRQALYVPQLTTCPDSAVRAFAAGRELSLGRLTGQAHATGEHLDVYLTSALLWWLPLAGLDNSLGMNRKL